ncbi:MAG: ABC transporter substrate-binding protein, partial [Methanomicrobiales archaeon]|nr:ABC transporter substrate-binding protein [Methanomicrobiales archaeon]
MRGAGYFIAVMLAVLGLALVCGCSTQWPAAETGKSPGTAPHSTDAGLRIITEDFPPFNYAGADGKAAGQSTEVVEGILARLNQTASIEVLPWSEGYRL